MITEQVTKVEDLPIGIADFFVYSNQLDPLGPIIILGGILNNKSKNGSVLIYDQSLKKWEIIKNVIGQ